MDGVEEAADGLEAPAAEEPPPEAAAEEADADEAAEVSHEWDGEEGNFAMLAITFDKQAETASEAGCEPLDRMDVVKVFSEMAASFDGLPILPQRGLQALGPKGPWIIYIKEVYAKAFVDLIPRFTVLGQPLYTEFRRISTESLSMARYSDDFITRTTLYADLFLKPGAEFFFITKSDVTSAMRKQGIKVIKSARPCAKFGDQSMGSGLIGEKINVTFSADTALLSTIERIEFRKEVLKGVWMDFSLPFTIGAPKGSPYADFVANIHTKGCHRYLVQEKGKDRPLCVCSKGEGASPRSGKGRGAGKGRGSGGGQQSLGKRSAEEAYLGSVLKKSDKACSYYKAGTCSHGVSCNLAHDPDFNPRSVTCRVEKRTSGRCKAGANCRYAHNCACSCQSFNSPPTSPNIMSLRAPPRDSGHLLLACQHPADTTSPPHSFTAHCQLSADNPTAHPTLSPTSQHSTDTPHTHTHHLRSGITTSQQGQSHKYSNHSRRALLYSYWGHRWQIKFDKCLGYPGEGPSLPSQAKMLGINPNGLKSPGRLKYILKMAASNSIDILFIQEHNFKKKSKSTFELAARYAGYAACVGYLLHRIGGRGH